MFAARIVGAAKPLLLSNGARLARNPGKPGFCNAKSRPAVKKYSAFFLFYKGLLKKSF